MDKAKRPVTPDEQRCLSALFETLAPPLEDAGFSANVLRRIRRRVRWRRGILAVAAIIGGALALGPFLELSVQLSGLPVRVSQLSVQMLELSVQMSQLSVQLSGLSVLLSEGLLTMATGWNDPASLARNQMVLILVLLAVAFPGAIRLLER